MSPNVLLVILDSVRAGHTSLYGYHRRTTPFLSKFSDRCLTYQRAVAPGVDSIKSHASIFTGEPVISHGLDSSQCLAEGETIWSFLNDRGYETGVFSQNSFLTQAPIGLKQDFTTVVGGKAPNLPFPEAADPTEFIQNGDVDLSEFIKSSLLSRTPARSVWNGFALLGDNLQSLPYKLQISDSPFTDRFISWKDEVSGEWAACINYMSAHTVYNPLKQYNKWSASDASRANEVDMPWDYFAEESPALELSQLRDIYDGSIRTVDAEVERLISNLTETGEIEDTLIVVTADHGEGFGEQLPLRDIPSIGHGTTGGLGEGVLHVPLLMYRPHSQSTDSIPAPVCLSSFPDVVKAFIEPDGHTPRFDTEGPVIASDMGLDPLEQNLAAEHITNIESLKTETHVIYTHSESVEKNWIQDGRVVDREVLHGESDNPGHPDNSEIERWFSGIELSPKVAGASGDISDRTAANLEDLGYL